ncbi:MAG TPA: hypothetical protein VGL53_31825 [Bryobacteraceae bacterium]|jgi:hypothetical protein
MRRLCLCLFTLCLLWQPGRGFDGGASFTGYLERVGDHSISVKLADRRVIDAMLPETFAFAPSALAARFAMGDEVKVTCKPIPSTWEAATSRLQSLEVTAIRRIRKLSPEEVSKLLEARSREGRNYLERPEGLTSTTPQTNNDPDAPGSKELEQARRVNLERLSKIPNYVADETAQRFRSTDSSRDWTPYDTIESEVAFRGRQVVRQQIRRNGKLWDRPFDALPGFKWYEGFETEIEPLFRSDCPTTIEYHGRSKLEGEHKVLEYRFHSPVDGCFPFLYFTYQRYNPARSGRIYVSDNASGNVVRVDDEASGFPADFEFSGREEHLSWDNVKIGDSTHLLPVRASFLVSYRSGTRYKVEVEYRNHRHFEASSNVTFH